MVRSDPLSTPEDVFHPTFKLSFVIVKIQKSNSNCFKSSKKVFDFHRTDCFKLNQLLSTINWELVFSSNESINNFISDLNKMVLLQNVFRNVPLTHQIVLAGLRRN